MALLVIMSLVLLLLLLRSDVVVECKQMPLRPDVRAGEREVTSG